MNIDNLTLGEIKQLTSLFNQNTTQHPYEIGKNYIIRTVTMIDIGRLVDVMEQELILEDASWVADTGRFNECFDGNFNEVEPFPDGRVIVGRGAVIDVAILKCELPRDVK